MAPCNKSGVEGICAPGRHRDMHLEIDDTKGIPIRDMTILDEYVEEVLAEYKPRYILDEPIPEDEERRSAPATSTTVAI